MANHCLIYRASDECWYLEFNENGVNVSGSRTWGPFQVRDYAQQYLGVLTKSVQSFDTDDTMKRPPPRMSPDGSLVQLPDYGLIRVASAPCEFHKVEWGTEKRGDIFYLYCPKDQVVELAFTVAGGHHMSGSLQRYQRVENVEEIYLFWNSRGKLVKRAKNPVEADADPREAPTGQS